MELSDWQEEFIQGLDKELRAVIECFIDDMVMQSGEDGRYLYLSGINDGIRLSKAFMKL